MNTFCYVYILVATVLWLGIMSHLGANQRHATLGAVLLSLGVVIVWPLVGLAALYGLGMALGCVWTSYYPLEDNHEH